MTDIRTVWKSQKVEESVTLDNIREKAKRVQRVIRRRNMVEYIASVFVTIVFGSYVWLLPGPVVKAGSALIIVGTFYVVWQLHRRASAEAVPEQSTAGVVAYYRQVLIRQRDALRAVWRWYLAPFVPGLLVMMVGFYVDAPAADRMRMLWVVLIVVLPFIALVFAGVWWLNARVARMLTHRIEELDLLR